MSGKMSVLDQRTLGLEDMSNEPLKRGSKGSCEKTGGLSAQAKLGQDPVGAGHYAHQPLQLEKDLPVAGRGRTGIQERS